MQLSLNHRRVLKHLRSNARMSFSNISRKTRIPVTTVFDHYQKLLKHDIISKHTSLINYKLLGFFYRSFVFVKARNRDELLSFLNDHESVNSVFVLNEFDFMIDIIFPGIKEFYLFLDDLRDFGIMKLELHDVIEHVKKEEFKV